MRSLFILVVCGIMAAPVFADDGIYLSASTGMAVMDDAKIRESQTSTSIKLDFNKGAPIAVAVGVRNQDTFRGEIELSTQTNALDNALISSRSEVSIKGDLSSTALLANGYYDFINTGALIPYISLGLGIAEVSIRDASVRTPNPESTELAPLPDIEIYSFDDEDIVFAYQAGAGPGYAIGSHFTIDLKYRYFGTNKADFDNGKMDYTSHNFYLGVRYGF